MSTDYRRSHILPNKGRLYHAGFTDNPYRNMIWQFEKRILDNITKTLFADGIIQHLDFACGTGRVLSYLMGRASTSVGVDLSPSMLEVARKNSRTAEIIEADLTRSDVLGDRKFNLITAFRFFPNAEANLRTEAMQVLSRHLDDNGYLVFNNHKNTGSTRNRLARLFGCRGYKGMSIVDVKKLLAKTGLEIVKTYHLCVFPASENHGLLPLFLLRPLDALLSKCRFFKGLGENLIFVCRRSVSRFDEKE